MLIIFDLDDTLIDTSGAITPFKMRQCLKRLIEEGAEVPDFEEAYAKLLSLNSTSARSQDAILCFATQIGCQNTAKALAELTKPLPPDFVIPLTPAAKEILTFFKSNYLLTMVTAGSPSFQREKMKKAGLDSSLFSKIAIPEDSIKKPAYEALTREFLTDPRKTWVCGDRVEVDLVPARELGLRTVHMRWGRGKLEMSPNWVDYSISSLSELKGIIR